MDEDEVSPTPDVNADANADAGVGVDVNVGGLSAAQALGDVQKARTAFEKATTSNQNLFNAAMDRLRTQRVGPSSAEQLFAIASALQKPTRTGSFFETLGNVGSTMGEAEKAKREAIATRDAMAEKYGLAQSSASLEALKAQLASSGQMYRAVTAAEVAKAKAGRPIFRGTEKLNDGTIVAIYEDPNTGSLTKQPIGQGEQQMMPTTMLSDGQPVFRMGSKLVLGDGTQVTKIDKPERKMSPTEMRMITQDEDALTGATTAIVNLKTALELSPKAYEGGFTRARQLLGGMFSSDSPEYVNSELLDNLLKKNALAQLKATFPGAISNAETQILTKLQGAANQPRAVREAIMKDALDALQQIEKRVSKHRDAVLSGAYGVVRNPATSSAPSKSATPRVINWARK